MRGADWISAFRDRNDKKEDTLNPTTATVFFTANGDNAAEINGDLARQVHDFFGTLEGVSIPVNLRLYKGTPEEHDGKIYYSYTEVTGPMSSARTVRDASRQHTAPYFQGANLAVSPRGRTLAELVSDALTQARPFFPEGSVLEVNPDHDFNIFPDRDSKAQARDGYYHTGNYAYIKQVEPK